MPLLVLLYEVLMAMINPLLSSLYGTSAPRDAILVDSPTRGSSSISLTVMWGCQNILRFGTPGLIRETTQRPKDAALSSECRNRQVDDRIKVQDS